MDSGEQCVIGKVCILALLVWFNFFFFKNTSTYGYKKF